MTKREYAKSIEDKYKCTCVRGLTPETDTGHTLLCKINKMTQKWAWLKAYNELKNN